MRRAHLNTPRICAHQRSYFIPIDPTAQMKKYLVLVVLFAILFQFEVAQAQHYFVKYLGKNCSFENANGVYIEHDFHLIPEQFQDLQNRLENDLIHMWTKHSGNNFRVWFQNSRGYTLYHDALDMKWHLVDPMTHLSYGSASRSGPRRGKTRHVSRSPGADPTRRLSC